VCETGQFLAVCDQSVLCCLSFVDLSRNIKEKFMCLVCMTLLCSQC